MKLKFYEENKSIIWTVVVMILLFFLYTSYLRPAPFAMNDYARSGFGDVSTEAKVAYDSYINLESKEYDEDKAVLKSIPEKYNGFFTNENEYKSSYGNRKYRTYTLNFKVPVENFQKAVDDVKQMAELKSLSIKATDLTQQYEDYEAYLNSYKAEKAKVEELLSQAETVTETIQIQERLFEIQREIDRYQQLITNLERETDYSDLRVTLEEKRPLSEELVQWTGIREHVKNIVESFDNVLVVITSLFAWIIIAVIGYIIYRSRK